MLAPKAVVFATSKAYLLDIEAMLGAEGYRASAVTSGRRRLD